MAWNDAARAAAIESRRRKAARIKKLVDDAKLHSAAPPKPETQKEVKGPILPSDEIDRILGLEKT